MSEPIHRSPAFQFYADDFIAGTADMSAEEVGAFIRLLCHQWSKGSIPADEDRSGRIAGLLGSPSLRYVMAKFSPCVDGQLRNNRLELVRAESAKYRAKQVESGKAGASKRWSNPQNPSDPNRVPMPTPLPTPLPTPMANQCPQDSSPSPSPTNTPKAPKGAEPVGFADFWGVYPRKESKVKAINAWKKNEPDQATQSRILKDVVARKASEAWTKENGQYIPHPASYLNQRRWEDLIEVPQTKEMLADKLRAHPGNPNHVAHSTATSQQLCEFSEMLTKYKAMP